MSWSTRELAELSETSVRTIRHYHDIGLLSEPPRRANGYKQYGTDHLVTVLRIKRLSSLGFPLERIGSMLDSTESAESTDAALDELDAELIAAIARLNEVRAEIARTRAAGAPADISAEALQVMEAVGSDKGLAVVIAQMFTDSELTRFLSALSHLSPEYAALNDELSALAPDASAAAITRLAEQMTVYLQRFLAEHPEYLNEGAPQSHADRQRTGALVAALSNGLNPAQAAALEVLTANLARFPRDTSIAR